MISRRNVLHSSTAIPLLATGSLTGALATCSSSGGIQIDPNVLVAINNAVAMGCNWIPAITTVIALVNASFPAVSGAASVAESVIAQVAATLCAAKPTPLAGGKLGAAKIAGTDVVAHGWVVQDGKLVYV